MMKTFSLRRISVKPITIPIEGPSKGNTKGRKHFSKKISRLPKLAMSATTSAVCLPIEGLNFVAKHTASATTAAVSLPIEGLTLFAKHCKKAVVATPKLEPMEPITEEDLAVDLTPEAPREKTELEILIAKVLADDGARSQVAQTLLQYVQKAFNEALIRASDPQDPADSQLSLILVSATSVVKEFLLARYYLREETEKLDDLSPILDVAQQCLEQYLEPQVLFHLDCTSLDAETSPSEAAEGIIWLKSYFDAIGLSDKDSHPWTKHLEDLMATYVDRGVKSSMKFFLESSLKLEIGDGDLHQIQQGKMITCAPADISYMYNMQIEVAKGFPAPCIGEIVSACNEELLSSIGGKMIAIGSTWKNTSPARLCALINDATRICDECEERNEKYLVNDNHVAVGEQLCRALTELAVFATKQLSERILLDVMEDSEPILTTIGNGAVWEEPGDIRAVKRTNATLGDYFQDLEIWIQSPYFFPKLLKYCFDLALERYLFSFFCNSIAGRTTSAELAAEALRRDYGCFVSFWNGELASKYHGTAGFYTQNVINFRLHFLLSMAILISPEVRGNEVQEEMETIMVELGDNGVPAILHLVGIRGRCSPKDALDWHETVTKVEQITKAEGYQREPAHSYSLPDPRNSKYLWNVQPPRAGRVQRLQRSKCGEAIDISSTSAMVKPRRLSYVCTASKPLPINSQSGRRNMRSSQGCY